MLHSDHLYYNEVWFCVSTSSGGRWNLCFQLQVVLAKMLKNDENFQKIWKFQFLKEKHFLFVKFNFFEKWWNFQNIWNFSFFQSKTFYFEENVQFTKIMKFWKKYENLNFAKQNRSILWKLTRRKCACENKYSNNEN